MAQAVAEVIPPVVGCPKEGLRGLRLVAGQIADGHGQAGRAAAGGGHGLILSAQTAYGLGIIILIHRRHRHARLFDVPPVVFLYLKNTHAHQAGRGQKAQAYE